MGFPGRNFAGQPNRNRAQHRRYGFIQHVDKPARPARRCGLSRDLLIRLRARLRQVFYPRVRRYRRPPTPARLVIHGVIIRSHDFGRVPDLLGTRRQCHRRGNTDPTHRGATGHL